MPRGRPKRIVVVRLDPEMFEEVRRYSGNVSQAVEQALASWLRRERRKAGTAPLARHLAPPTEREVVARKAGDGDLGGKALTQDPKDST